MTTQLPRSIRIATRESALALAQSEWVAAQCRQFAPGLSVSLVGMTTKGDQILDKPLAQIGGKGLFIKELEVAMSEGRADIAVHSMKDMPMVLPEGFSAVIVGAREDVRDAFVSNRFPTLESLPAGAVVGTSSLRRESTLLHYYPHLIVKPLRGNVNTRLKKLDAGEFDAVILAAAGLTRLGFSGRIAELLTRDRFIPAIAQGALGIEYPSHRSDLAELLGLFAQPSTTAGVAAERAFGRRLSASCDVPLGASAHVEGDALSITGFISLPDGSSRITAQLAGRSDDAEALGLALAETLLSRGGQTVLDALNR